MYIINIAVVLLRYNCNRYKQRPEREVQLVLGTGCVPQPSSPPNSHREGGETPPSSPGPQISNSGALQMATKAAGLRAGTRGWFTSSVWPFPAAPTWKRHFHFNSGHLTNLHLPIFDIFNFSTNSAQMHGFHFAWFWKKFHPKSFITC